MAPLSHTYSDLALRVKMAALPPFLVPAIATIVLSISNLNKDPIAVSAISTAKDIYGTIHIIVAYSVGIFPFNDNKCDVTDTLLPHGAAEVSFQPAQPTK